MRTLIWLLIALAVLLAAGCANPGIVQVAPNTYMLSRSDRAGIFGNAAKMKADVFREANEFAASKGKVAIPVTTHETPMFPGHFATFDYQFRLVDKDDPEAQKAVLMPRADVVVEKTEKVSADVHAKDETPKTPDLYTEILKLDDLRKKGLITDAEYEAQKTKLLNQSR